MTILVNNTSTSSGSHTWLFLTQQLRQEVGASGSGPLTCQNQTGESKRLADWINAAWMDVQQIHADWDWLRKSFSFTTVAQQPNYIATTSVGLTDFANWKKNSFRAYTTNQNYADEMIMPWIDYEEYRNLYQYGNMRTTYNRPVTFSIGPLKDIWLGAIPDGTGYTIVGDYYSAPSQFVNDTDTPPAAFPDRFWKLIVFKAMMLYATYEENQSLYAAASIDYNRMLSRMEYDELPPIGYGASLA
ncbi:hypothetical protein A4F89_06600 [Polynucleobacter asymbioticus]|uniref:phage adaptor protein n=1 Tax=Polynucleobacter asymbioticus TaxID=576611 RepID=UPI0008FB9FDD|nr:hypothetical protein [Polynucleobacter asymbioticus]APB99018.1 hypothetical protein A4F89_06600 [Polynucleobacter asymbioticus]